LSGICYTTDNIIVPPCLHLRKECLWLGQSTYIHLKIQIGANIRMPAHCIVNAGFLATTPQQANLCTRSFVCRARPLFPRKSKTVVCIVKTVAGVWRQKKKPLPGNGLRAQPHRLTIKKCQQSKPLASVRDFYFLQAILRGPIAVPRADNQPALPGGRTDRSPARLFREHRNHG
jgi:hypothetical protein